MNSRQRELYVNSWSHQPLKIEQLRARRAAWPYKTASIEVGPAGAANMRLAHWAAPACLTTPSSIVDQYAEDGCGQHIASMSASIRDRLIALALYRMASATPEADETHPQSHSYANPISLLERLYRLRLVSAGILWRGG